MRQASCHNLPDSELARLLQNGEPDAFSHLSKRYLPLLSYKAGRYANGCDLDAEDFIQEGLIALYRAASTYEESGGASFKTYASACIDNSMVDAVRRFARSSGRGGFSLEDIGEWPLHKGAEPVSRVIPPEDAYAQKEQFRLRMRQIGRVLSHFERRVVILRLEGYSYRQIARRLEVSVKSVDNAMQRVKRKLAGTEPA